MKLMELPSSSSSTSTHRWKYDVFLSFSGQDTRINFTDHLCAALRAGGIRTFRDDNELDRGEEIGPELLKAIEDSRFAVIVFSKTYASSTWCLNELAHMMSCRETLGQMVVPVFYHVDPSDVRKQKRSFQEAFAGHEERFKEEMIKVHRWRAALKEAADIQGVDVLNHGDRHESTIIKDIVRGISEKLNRKILSTALDPVGLHPRATAVISLLYDEPDDVCVVGIYGIPGMGKTTIANEVFNSIFSNFESSCFLPNVREISKRKGMARLQNQLLSEIFKKGNHEKIYNEDRGVKVIEERLCSMRVLIVLDDVDKLEQVHKILGNLDWLCSGSRILITTRIKDLLKPSPLYRQYEVKKLDQEESLQLLSINAFDKLHPPKKYMECATSVVRYVGGMPLAVEVLGSSLSGQSLQVWESRLEKLRAIPKEDIQKKLETSYYALDDTEKDLFLDIACFFTKKDKDYVISILDGCDFFPIDGINTLIKWCLVKIDSDNKLVMHDLIQDMGREIVRQQSPKEPGNRSRVWRHAEALDVLTDETGTQAVEGLSLSQPESSENLRSEALIKMKNLRLLQLNYANLEGSYKHISKKLRWLCWREYPLESIPADLRLENLVALEMRYSSLKQVWEEVKVLKKLKFLNLSHSHELIKTSDFTGLLNLETLMLKDCTSLVEVHESIGHLTKLVILSFEGCRDLNNLPRSICALASLVNLNISGCLKLNELPEEIGNMESLVVLDANDTSISRLPNSFADLKNLVELSMSNCPLTPQPRKGPSLISALPLPCCLRRLDLTNCNLSDGMIPDDLKNLPQLEDLRLSGNNFSSLPASIGLLHKLRQLLLDNCRRLQLVPELPSSLEDLDARNCTSLERIHLKNCHRVMSMDLDSCHKLDEIEWLLKLEPIGVEIVQKLLGTHGFSTASDDLIIGRSITRTRRKFRISPLLVVYERGIYSVFVPGSKIPNWCNYQSESDSITFKVPPLQGRKILGFVICAVHAYFWGPYYKYYPCPTIIITNKTKMIVWYIHRHPYQARVSWYACTMGEDIMWVSNCCFLNVMEHDDVSHGDYEACWRFKNETEEGDEVEVLIGELGGGTHDVEFELMSNYGIFPEKCGVQIVYQQTEPEGSGILELAMMPRFPRNISHTISMD